jgi:hypothetical protein
MSNFNEADHPRHQSGRFSEKQQSAPVGTLVVHENPHLVPEHTVRGIVLDFLREHSEEVDGDSEGITEDARERETAAYLADIGWRMGEDLEYESTLRSLIERAYLAGVAAAAQNPVANNELTPGLPMSYAEATKAMDKDGFITVVVEVPTVSLLRASAEVAGSSSDSYIHTQAFDYGYPYDSEWEMLSSNGDTSVVRYKTCIGQMLEPSEIVPPRKNWV